MSLVKVPVEDLRKFAYDHDVNGDDFKKAALVHELSELGFTYENFVDWYNAKNKAEAPVVDRVVRGAEDSEDGDTEDVEDTQNKVLVKMNRKNTIYEAYGVRFTQEAPLQLMNPEDASALLENVEGFARVSARDASQYFDL